jgi:hypothetical protein
MKVDPDLFIKFKMTHTIVFIYIIQKSLAKKIQKNAHMRDSNADSASII